MIYKPLEVDELIDERDENVQFIDLLQKEDSQLKIVSLKKHQEIEPHSSESNACIYVTEGEIEIMFDGDCYCYSCGCGMSENSENNQYTYRIKKNQLFLFEKDVRHSVRALKDSSYLLIKI